MGNVINLQGKRFGKLLVLSLNRVDGNAHWDCLCDCGNKTVVRGNLLNYGSIISCGCAQKEKAREIRKTHGMSRTKIYKAWFAMKDRCYNKSHSSYKNYGGRGILVCDKWRVSFENFISDMGERPSPKHSIDRIDNNGNYEPSNCRWATKKQQCANKRNNFIIEFFGIKMTRGYWAEELGVSVGYLMWNMKIKSIEEILNSKKCKNKWNSMKAKRGITSKT